MTLNLSLLEALDFDDDGFMADANAWTKEIGETIANVLEIELTEDHYAVLQFGGGCQGCSAVDQTLKGGVEKTLMEQLPQLKGVRDMTDHTDRSQAYY